MKNLIILLVVGLLTPQITQAQGTIYMSNLGQPSAGSVAVGSDSWQAVLFQTGTNAAGYTLNSIQLAMTDASGSPSGFTVMIYGNGNIPRGDSLGGSLGTLSGSTDPAISGTYTYTDNSSLMLLPDTSYSIVLTSGTAIATGAYEWSYAGTYSYNLSGGWGAGGGLFTSSDGSSWSESTVGNLQYAVNVTAIPEPSVFGLTALGGLLFLRHRREAF
jgi:hypothetical protein